MEKTDISRRGLIRAALAAGAVGGFPFKSLAATSAADLDDSYIYYCPELVEITEPGPLVRPDGTSVCGWSRRPLLDLNLEDARFWPLPALQRYRLKKWDMYHVTSPEYYFQFLVAWIGYGAFASAYVYDRAANEHLSGMHLRLPRPEIPMMRDSTAGITEYPGRKVRMAFEVEGEHHRLTVDFPGFADKGLAARVDLVLPADYDSICGVHLTNPRRMHYGRKINCMEGNGTFTLGGRTVELDPQNSFGMLDFGRGYYPPKLFWYWAVASGRDGKGKALGFNLGHGNSPLETNENAVFYDGRLNKIGITVCTAPPDDRLKDPWTVKDKDGRVDLTLTPVSAKKNKMDLGGLYSNGRQALGAYNGYVVLDSGERIEVRDLFGLYEWVDQKW